MSDMGKNIVLWLIILAVLLTVFNNFEVEQKQQPMAYSEFIDAVERGEVREATIQDNKITATDGTNTGEITNSLHLSGADPTSSDWVNYSDLTESKCLEWIKSAFNGLEKDMQTIAAAALAEKTATPSSVKGKPF